MSPNRQLTHDNERKMCDTENTFIGSGIKSVTVDVTLTYNSDNWNKIDMRDAIL